MSVFKERKLLIQDGEKLTDYVPFEVFKKKWYKLLSKETPDIIIREFWEDYLTSSAQDLEDYLKTR